MGIDENNRTLDWFDRRHPVLAGAGFLAALPVLYFGMAYPIACAVTGCWNPNGWTRCVSKYDDLKRQVYVLADRNNDGHRDAAEDADMCRRLGYEKYFDRNWHCANPSFEEMEGAIKSYQAELKKQKGQ